MTNSEFIENRCKNKVDGAYVLIKDVFEDANQASRERGIFVCENGGGSGCGWGNFECTPFIQCVELPFKANGVKVYGLLIK